MTAAIVLAAGEASRMGRPKQVLCFDGPEPLVVRVVRRARAAGLSPVVVVTGAHAALVETAVGDAALLAHNPRWSEGMGSSIAVGVNALAEAELLDRGRDIDALAVLLADQPFVDTPHLVALETTLHASDADIVACAFAGTLGPPAFFRRPVFSALAALPPHAGARALFTDARFRLATFSLPEAAADLDTPADLITAGKSAEQPAAARPAARPRT